MFGDEFNRIFDVSYTSQQRWSSSCADDCCWLVIVYRWGQLPNKKYATSLRPFSVKQFVQRGKNWGNKNVFLGSAFQVNISNRYRHFAIIQFVLFCVPQLKMVLWNNGEFLRDEPTLPIRIFCGSIRVVVYFEMLWVALVCQNTLNLFTFACG